jgi:hypothetical protein
MEALKIVYASNKCLIRRQVVVENGQVTGRFSW